MVGGRLEPPRPIEKARGGSTVARPGRRSGMIDHGASLKTRRFAASR